MLRVLFVASEVYPYAQTGGLGEVAGSLPNALTALGCDVRIVMPAYAPIRAGFGRDTQHCEFEVPGYVERTSIVRPAPVSDADVLFVDTPALFDRPGGPYADELGRDFPDNAYRFAFFSHAVAGLARGTLGDGWLPDVVHCHDWQTALVPALLAQHAPRPATVFTVHNLAFRGLCDRATFENLRLPADMWHLERLEFHGQCALIKGGLVYADRLTTVSPTYAREIQTTTHGFGLEGLLQARATVLEGILNGIDYQTWDPQRDPALVAPYDAGSLARRRHNKHALQTQHGLEPDPDCWLLGTVSRLTEQKGIDLILDAMPALGALPIQLLVLGSGEPALEAALRELAATAPRRIAFLRGYDPELSHRMFGGLDAFLMPSRFEPCGLSQLYSQRYGTVPIVRRTGGLNDSVLDPAGQPDAATGFVFESPTAAALGATIERAHSVYRRPAEWAAIQRNGMRLDRSWRHSAQEYLMVYERARRAALRLIPA